MKNIITEPKTKLTGGTLFVIALIVLLLGNTRNIEIVEKLDDIQSDIHTLKKEMMAYKADVKRLEQENLELKQQIKNDN